MTFKQHLLLIVGGAFLVLFLALGYVLLSLSTSSRQTNILVEHTTAAQLAYTNLYASGLQASSSLRSVVLDPKNKTGYTNLKKGLEDFDTALAQAKALPPTPSQSADAIKRIEQLHEKRKQLISKATDLVQSNVPETINFLNKEEIPLWREIRDILLDQVKKARTDTEMQLKQSADSASRAILIGTLLTVLALGMAIVSITLIIRSINRNLGGDPATVAGIAQAIAQGNLSQKIENSISHSVMDSMQGMQRQLIASVSTIRSGTALLSSASANLTETEHGVAARVVVFIIDLLEVVQVQHQHSDGATFVRLPL